MYLLVIVNFVIINLKHSNEISLITQNVTTEITSDILQVIALFFTDVNFIGLISLENSGTTISSEVLNTVFQNKAAVVFDYSNLERNQSIDLTMGNTLSNYVIVSLDEKLIHNFIANRFNHSARKPSIIIITQPVPKNECVEILARTIANQLGIIYFIIMTGRKLATYDPLLDKILWKDLDLMPINMLKHNDLKISFKNFHGSVLKIFKFDTFDYAFRFSELDHNFCKTLGQYLNFQVEYKTFSEAERKILATKFHAQYFVEGKNSETTTSHPS